MTINTHIHSKPKWKLYRPYYVDEGLYRLCVIYLFGCWYFMEFVKL